MIGYITLIHKSHELQLKYIYNFKVNIVIDLLFI